MMSLHQLEYLIAKPYVRQHAAPPAVECYLCAGLIAKLIVTCVLYFAKLE